MLKPIFNLSIFSLCLLAANPKGGSGDCKITESGSEMQIEVGDRAILSWKDFSIDQGETTTFIQPNSSSVVLNRVISNNISKIQGMLNANGQVILINPNGIVVTKSGVINTGSFIASSLDVHDQAFLNNQTLEFFGTEGKGVINYGTIRAWDGDVALIGFSAQNHGTIEALNGDVHVLAGEKVFLKPSKSKRIYIQPKDTDQSKLLEEGNPYKQAFSHVCEEDALDVLQKDGQSFLVSSAVVTGSISSKNGGDVVVNGSHVIVDKEAVIDVSADRKNCAGSIFIGGSFQGKDPNLTNSNYTFVGKDVKLLANCSEEGNGGMVVLFSDGHTIFEGLIDVRGGSFSGDGGIVEVSGKQGFDFLGKTLRSAENGDAGKLYLDPDADIIIHNGNIYAGTFKQREWTPLGNESYIEIGNEFTPGTLLYELFQGDVLIQTKGSGFEEGGGNIIVQDDLIYHLLPGHDLTLRSEADIIVKAKLMNTGPGDIIIESCKNLILDASLLEREVSLGAFEGTVHIQKVSNNLLVKGGQNSPAVLGYLRSNNPISGNIVIDEIGGDLTLVGGSSEDAFALIGSYEAPSIYGSISIGKIGNNLTLKPNEGFCQIGNVQTTKEGFIRGDISIGEVVGNIDLFSSIGKAHIGHGSLGNFTYEQRGDILIKHVGGDVNLHSSENFSQIGHANKKGSNASKIGDITLNVDGDINLIPGTEDKAYSLIGHGGNKGSFDHGLLKGDIWVFSKGKIFVGGNSGDTFATIGFALDNIETKNPVKIESKYFSVHADDDIIVESGSKSDAVIGGYLPLRPDQLFLSVENLAVNTKKSIKVEGYTSFDFDVGTYSEATIGFRPDMFSCFHDYNGTIGLYIHADEKIKVQGSWMSADIHPAYIRGINRNVPSIISAKEDISFCAENHGEAAVIHDGPLQIISKQGSIEFLSAETQDAYAKIYGNNLEMLAEKGIILKEPFSNSGKIHIVKDEDDDEQTIFYSKTIYRPKDNPEDPLEMITIAQTKDSDQDGSIRSIKITDDLVFVDTYSPQSSSFLSISCNGQSADQYFRNSKDFLTYEGNILTSEFLFRITPIMEYLGYKECFSLSERSNEDSYMFRKRPFFIRRPLTFLKGYKQNPFYW